MKSHENQILKDGERFLNNKCFYIGLKIWKKIPRRKFQVKIIFRYAKLKDMKIPFLVMYVASTFILLHIEQLFDSQQHSSIMFW